MSKYILTKSEIDAFEGSEKTHFLNDSAKRLNKSLGDLTSLQGFGFYLIEVAPGGETTEQHMHHHEDECVYILEGTATAIIDDESHTVSAGDFIGYRAGGASHTIINTGETILKAIVVGQRLDHDVVDYPKHNKRLFRQKGLEWDLVDVDHLDHPNANKK